MKEEATHYECDCPECDKEYTTFHGERALYGGINPIEGWIILENGYCYCSLKCFLSVQPDSPQLTTLQGDKE